MYSLSRMEQFRRNVLSKYNVYNSVFITLPFDAIDNTGSLLPLFAELCDKGFQQGLSPEQIVDGFIEKYLEEATQEEVLDLLFRFIQYVERQIVLFDAVEDAAFNQVNHLEGPGTLTYVKEAAANKGTQEELRDFLDTFEVRPVLTAHPTQFYPGSVLGIITDLTKAISEDNLFEIKRLLSQLGKTPFIKKEKPTPFDEAVSLIWYLENVFYRTMGEIADYICREIYEGRRMQGPVLRLGFWPGGDRDGNPFVTTEITLQVADRLRTSILKNYYYDIRKLKRRLTFSGVTEIVAGLEDKLYRSVFYSKGEIFIGPEEFRKGLAEIRHLLMEKHQSLFVEEVDSLLNKLHLFGFHFATLDIRQNSKIHEKALRGLSVAYPELLSSIYFEADEADKIRILENLEKPEARLDLKQEDAVQTLDSIRAIRTIQERNSEQGCNRYIISNNNSAHHVLEALQLFRLAGWENPTVDIVPLLEAVDDLKRAGEIMEALYTSPTYSAHLKSRGNKQTVMLGFSDGTKDGGYLMANWSIYRAKEIITAMSRKYDVEVIFFDGRGGPPARGGGKTHKFYASLGSGIENREIEVTVQGQTISSNFGTPDSCRFNLENLLSAGIYNHLESQGENDLDDSQREIMDRLAQLGYERYMAFKNHDKFLPYLEQMSALKYYAMVNIGSRPVKRNSGNALQFDDLRAIPFVGSWSMLKQNVPGFFGVGTALKRFETEGRWDEVRALYDNSLFFRTLLENSMMSLAKSFFPLTAYMKNDPEFGAFWELLYGESELTKTMLLKLAGHQTLMQNYPEGKASIEMREEIVLPLLTIQQYALSRIRSLQQQPAADEEAVAVYEKLVTRALFGNTNASRNSA